MPLTLTLTHSDDIFLLRLANLSDAPVSVWSTSCSWGHTSYFFHLSPAGRPVCEIRRKPAIWTANTPIAITIAPGDSHAERFSLSDGTWDLSRCIAEGAGDISVVMEAEADTAAAEAQVLTGHYETNRLHVAQLQEVIHG